MLELGAGDCPPGNGALPHGVNWAAHPGNAYRMAPGDMVCLEWRSWKVRCVGAQRRSA